MIALRPLALAVLSVACVPAGCARTPTAPATAITAATTAPPAGWEALPWGARPVGFRQEMLVDPARRYRWQSRPHDQAAYAPRPILMNVWYPAAVTSVPAMTVAGYLHVPEHPALEPGFARRLSRHVHRTLLAETIGARAPAGQVGALLAKTTVARRDAPAAAGTFPLVLYHPGLGGAFADNMLLAELLASHGYVVVSSAFQSDRYVAMNIDWDIERSTADLLFLLGVLRANPSVDWGRMAVMGHSYGAQAALTFAMRSGLVDAVVSLDSTIENMPKEFMQRPHLTYHFGGGERLRAPLLLFSNPKPRYRGFLDSLVWSDRTYITLAGMDHNHYISHGGALSGSLLPGYVTVCRAVLAFLDRHVRGARPAAADPIAALADRPQVKVERLPARAGYRSSDDMIRAVLGGGGAAEVERTCRASSCDPVMLADAVAELTLFGEPDAAQALLDRVAGSLARFRAEQERGRIAEERGNRDQARAHLREARRLVDQEKAMSKEELAGMAADLDDALRQLEEPK